MMFPSVLALLRQRLQELERRPWAAFDVPGVWVGQRTTARFPSPPSYHLNQLAEIERIANDEGSGGGRRRDVVYNALVRYVTTYEHGPRADEEGWSTDGTLLKMLSLLPYLHRLGVGTISLLPIFERGVIGRKGDLGSPYAVRHPLRLDHTLVEPALGMSADEVFKAFVAACHLLGIKVVLEFALRTASIDSDLVPHHPEWFYWVEESVMLDGSFAKPLLSEEAIAKATTMVEEHDFKDLPPPDDEYRALFTSAPTRVRRDGHGWLGIRPNGDHVRVPGAFADWPPDDPQPAWTDVTYLRLHEHPDFRYMAYNTVRYFEQELDVQERRLQGLWNLIAGVIPHYVRLFDIDGAMIDMGHALPVDLQRRVIRDARSMKPSFTLWEENFHLRASSSTSGYDAVVGYLPFDAHDRAALRAFISRIRTGDVPVRYFATPETHNTPRAASRSGGVAFAMGVWTFLRCLPMGVPYLHAGMEMGVEAPVNTGLGFSQDDLARWTVDRLPLFSRSALPWDDAGEHMQVFALLEQRVRSSSWHDALADDDIVDAITSADDEVVGYVRISRRRPIGIIVLFNMSDTPLRTTFAIRDTAYQHVIAPDEHIEGTDDGTSWSVVLDAWECIVVSSWHTPH